MKNKKIKVKIDDQILLALEEKAKQLAEFIKEQQK